MSKKSLAVLAGCALALFAALYGGLLLSGLRPLETDIMDTVRTSNAIPHKTFLGWIFSPWSEAVYEDGWFADILARPVQPYFFKFVYTFFRDNTTVFLLYRLDVAVLLAVALYALAYFLTGDILLSLLASLFILTNPGTAASLMEFWDIEPLGELFFAVSAICFMGIFESFFGEASAEKKRGWGRFSLALVLMYLCGVFAVKAKDTEKLLLPGVFWGSIVLCTVAARFRPSFKIRYDARFPWFLAVCVLLALPLVWIKKIGVAPVENHPLDMLKLVFWNPNGWEPEKMISFFRLRRQLPCSVFASFGFLLSWILILLPIPLWGRLKQLGAEGQAGKPLRVLLFLALWLTLSLPICIVRPCLHLPRYLILPLVPVTLMFFYAAALVFGARKDTFARMGKALIVVLMLVQIGDNARHSLYFRNVLPAIWLKQNIMREEVYKDMTGKKSVSPLTLHRYMRDLRYPIERMDLLYPLEGKNPLKDTHLMELLQRFKAVYVASTEPLPPDPAIRFVSAVPALGNNPYSRLMKIFGKAAQEKLYLYEVREGFTRATN